MSSLRKTLLLTGSFLASVLLGAVVVVVSVIISWKLQMTANQAAHSGIGAMAEGISGNLLIGVPLLFGIVGVMLTLRWIERHT